MRGRIEEQFPRPLCVVTVNRKKWPKICRWPVDADADWANGHDLDIGLLNLVNR
jgi:hypothetical protein